MLGRSYSFYVEAGEKHAGAPKEQMLVDSHHCFLSSFQTRFVLGIPSSRPRTAKQMFLSGTLNLERVRHSENFFSW